MHSISNATLIILIFATFFTCFPMKVDSRKGAEWKEVVLTKVMNVSENKWKLPNGDMLLDIGEHCTVEHKTYNKTWRINELADDETIEVFWNTTKDPCDNPQQRRFMHCNPNTNKCECYRNWINSGGTPIYDEHAFEETNEWLEWSSEEEECMVGTASRCSLINEVSPYRCINHGRCIKAFYGDEFHYYCSNDSHRVKSVFVSFHTFLQLAVVIYYYYSSLFPLN